MLSDELHALTVRDVIADHETRLRAIERWRYALPVTLFTSLVAAVGSVSAAVIVATGSG